RSPVDEDARARAARVAAASPRDRRLAYLALLARAASPDDAWPDDVRAFFGDADAAWRDAVLALVRTAEPTKDAPTKKPGEDDRDRDDDRDTEDSKRPTLSAAQLVQR